MKKSFFVIFFFIFLFVPNTTQAARDVNDDPNIDNNSTGSWYTEDKTLTDALLIDWETRRLNLFDEAQNNKKPSDNEIFGISTKLKEVGSNFDTTRLNVNNVHKINTGRETIYVYDPNINNDPTINDQRILGVATDDERMYTFINPPIRESVEANTSLNNIDVDREVEVGSTVKNKNLRYSLGKQEERAQQKVTEDFAALNAAKKALEDQKRDNPSDTQRITQLESAIREAQAAYDSNNQIYNEIRSERGRVEEQARLSSQELTQHCASGVTRAVSNFFNLKCITEIIAKVSNIIFKLVSFIAYIAGTLFDYSLELSINSAEFFDRLGFIEVTWTFIRDILNMSFIFILLWTAIKILTGSEQYNAKKILTNVIVFAILMNFSLFAAKLMVDGSNVVSLKIYEAIKAGSGEKNKGDSISQRVMTAVGLSTLYNVNAIFDEKNNFQACRADNHGAIITVSVMGSIFLLILILALGLAAILFLIRMVNIIFLFIKSPLWVWSHVIPGNEYMEKIKKEWWAEMMHVVMFPIKYLFWMLVAVIMFGKLGQASIPTSTGNSGLIELICSAPAKGSTLAGQQISLVAIFAIVIIFMMKAIQYGVKSASGPSTYVGGGFAGNISKKFENWQKSMTTGLAKKAGVLSAGASVGAAKGSLKLAKFTGKTTARTLAGGIQGTFGKEKFTKGFADGFSNPSINLKEYVRDKATTLAAEGTNSAFMNATGLTSLSAKIANKYADPKNSAGKTRKEADEIRTAKAYENEALKTKAIEREYKVMTQKEWEKKNGVAEGQDADKYEEYIEKILEKRTDALIGKGASHWTAKNGEKHIENLKNDTIKTENITDASGAVIGRKVRFSEHLMHSAMSGIIDHHTTGTGAQKIDKNKFTTFRNIKAKARIKAIKDESKTYKKNTRNKETAEENKKRLEKAIKDIGEELTKMPPATDIESAVAVLTPIPTPASGYDSKKIRDVNEAIIKYNTEKSKGAAANAQKLLTLGNRLQDAKDRYMEHGKRLTKELFDKQNAYNEHLESEG